MMVTGPSLTRDDLHVGAEDAGLDPGPEVAQGLHHGADQGLGHRPRGGRGPGRAAALGQVRVERELADHQERRSPYIGTGLLAVEDAQAPQLGGELRGLLRGVPVGHADQDEQPRLLDGADYLAVHGHAGPAHSLYHCPHSQAGYSALPGTFPARASLRELGRLRA